MSESTALVPAPDREVVPEQPDHQTEISATTLAAEAEAIVKSKFYVAQARPRDIDMVRSRILKACRRPGFARAARYSKPVSGKPIMGPSIRFAEEAVRSMQNIDVSVRTIYEDDVRRKVRVDCVDLETNTGYSAEALLQKTVERRKLREGQIPLGQRVNSYGDTVYLIEATEDEMLTKTNAIVSKAIRTQGLRLVPADIVEEAMELCIKTARDADAQDPDGARRRILDSFDGIGVTPSDLKTHLGIDPQHLQPKGLEELRKVYQAIAEGETTWSEIVAQKDKETQPRSQNAKNTAEKAAQAAKRNGKPDEAA